MTTFSAVQSWTAFLLDGVTDTGLLDPAILSPRHELTPSEEARLQQAEILVAWGGELDAPAVQAFEDQNTGGKIILVAPDDNDDRFDWLDSERAINAVETLSTSLQTIYPEKSQRIARQADRLTKDIAQTAQQNQQLMALVNGSAVFLDSDRLLPFAEEQGLEVLGVLTYEAQMDITNEQLDAFVGKVEEYEQAVLLISSQIFTEALGETESKPSLSTIYIDPIIIGYVGEDHYQKQLSRNVLMLTAGLTTTPTIAKSTLENGQSE